VAQSHGFDLQPRNLLDLGGTALAGIAIMTVLSVPQFATHDMQYIPYAAIAGFIVAIPLAFIVARQLKGATSA
jgi:hypothetical protein